MVLGPEKVYKWLLRVEIKATSPFLSEMAID